MAVKTGKKAENLVVQYLLTKDWLIISKNFRSRYGEIDIIAEYQNHLIACEVKYRSKEEILPFSILGKQQKRIMNSLLYFWQNNPKYTNYNLRCDAFLVNKNSTITHFENAWLEQ